MFLAEKSSLSSESFMSHFFDWFNVKILFLYLRVSILTYTLYLLLSGGH